MANSDDLYLGKLDKGKEVTTDNVKNKVSLLDKVGFKDLANDVVRDAKDFGKGLASSVKDRFTFKNQRNQISNDIGFNTQEVSIANRHRDAISGILDNTFSGNLFDAGVNTLNLLNFGTKWKIAYTQNVDKDTYPFKYLYYYDLEQNKPNYISGEDTKFLSFLDELEDPTILGYSLRIDYESSPLFSNLGDTKNDYPKETNKNVLNLIGGEDTANIAADDIKQQSSSKKSKNNSCINFIEKYLPQHPEMRYAKSYLYEFKDYSKKIFTSPETEMGNENDYTKVKYKNSYIYSIKGLNRLDNNFVELKNDNDHESLELTLGEDIRMYVYRMFYIYKNLSWSYNMGKKLIPENLLRFNMYIKISDIRNYTSDISDDFKFIAKNAYSRIIYELKDCEFIFPENSNILPETLSLGGKEVNEQYADLKIKIKYRKVNRIFYSNFFNPNKTATIIGDKFFTPDKNKYFTDLQSMKFSPDFTLKRDSTDNNIPVEQSLKTKLDTLKNKGLLSEDNNDTAVTRFAKSVGNKAIKAGATIIDDKMQQAKAGINDLGKNIFNNNLSSTVRDLLKEKVQTKSKMLGKSLHLNTGKQFTDLNEVITYSSSHLPNVNTPKEDLHPNTGLKIKPPTEDLHPTTGIKTIAPSEDLHPITGIKTIAPSEDLHPDMGFQTTSPTEDLHPTTGYQTTSPTEDLHPITGINVSSPNEDLHPTTGFQTSSPNEDLHPNSNFDVKSPNEDLHPSTNFVVETPNEDLHSSVNNEITSPSEDLHVSKKSVITNPDANINPESSNIINSPSEDLHGKVDGNITNPKENLHNTNDFVRDEPNEDLHPNSNKDIQAPKENVNDSFTKFIKKNTNPPSSSPLDSFE
jgi:hypothetical protein